MSKKLPNLIAAEHLENVSTWQLPSMDGSDNVLPSAEKELRDRANRADEVIEDIDDEESLELSPITAEELQEITEAAEREGFEQGQKSGFETGEKAGYDAGYQAGMEKAQAEASEVLERQVSQLLQIAETLIEPIDQQQEQLEKTLLQFVTVMTEQVIERELIQDSSHILSCVKKAVAALPVGARDIQIILNPDDLALVEAYSEEFDKGWKFQGNNQLSPGGCLIETCESLVDFSVETKMKALFSQFLDRQLTDSSLVDTAEAGLEDGDRVDSDNSESALDQDVDDGSPEGAADSLEAAISGAPEERPEQTISPDQTNNQPDNSSGIDSGSGTDVNDDSGNPQEPLS